MATREYVFVVEFEDSHVGGQGPLLEGNVNQPPSPAFLSKVSAFFQSLSAGSYPARVLFAQTLITGGTAASGTITCTQASVSAGDTVVIGGKTFTAVTSGGRKYQGTFDIGATDNACAANLAAAAGANPDLIQTVAITVATNVVTVTSRHKTSYANNTTLAETGTGFVVSGANLASGANQTTAGDNQGYGGN